MDDRMVGIFIVLGIAILVFILINVTVHALFLLTLFKCMKKVKPENQAIAPGLVWLNLIPIFQIGWIFYTVIKIKESLSKEFDSRGLQGDGDFGFTMGLTYAICCCASAIPYLGLLIAIGAIVFWIIYWVKIANYSKQLNENSEFQDAVIVE